jgi:hypothetical protein
MSIEGSINVSALFHDKDGTTSLKVVSLESSTAYTTGKVALLTGTAGTAAVSFSTIGATAYRDASGSLVSFSAVQKVAFSWSGSSARVLSDLNDNAFVMRSANNAVAVSDATNFNIQPELSGGVGTGTYTIVLYGT